MSVDDLNLLGGVICALGGISLVATLVIGITSWGFSETPFARIVSLWGTLAAFIFLSSVALLGTARVDRGLAALREKPVATFVVPHGSGVCVRVEHFEPDGRGCPSTEDIGGICPRDKN